MFSITLKEVKKSFRDMAFIAVAIFLSRFVSGLNIDFFSNLDPEFLKGLSVAAINASWKYILTLGLIPFLNRFVRK